jgi:hypothetical protein
MSNCPNLAFGVTSRGVRPFRASYAVSTAFETV